MSTLYHVGIDLGTSQSSITNLYRKTTHFENLCGLSQRCHVSKRLDKDYLVGDEALENRLAVDLIWPLAEGVICDDTQSLETSQPNIFLFNQG